MDECEQRRIWRVRGEQREPAEDEIAREEPLEIRVNGHALTVTMRTPGHDEDLAAGFLVSEGIITAAAEIAEIRRTVRPDCNSVEVQLRDGVEVDLARLTRHVFASSSCGVCGKTTIAAVLQQFPPIASELAVPAAVIRSLPAKLSQSQPSFRRSGGLHAAAIFTATGELEIAREDIGRHNAVDKVIGEALRRDALPLDRHILLVS
ncbi:MAG TPA: formate dehydrogenase accessory sulfurtransferase FdhD, partial [Terriglobales bacterium]|nr:formate dehydrogenase accessory sulfurtransferase FdhD [Terriglobales bacterium]